MFFSVERETLVYFGKHLHGLDSSDSLNGMVRYGKWNSISWLEGRISLFGFLQYLYAEIAAFPVV